MCYFYPYFYQKYKKENKIKIYNGNKWIYQNKTETITDLIDSKYNILDTHYDCNGNILGGFTQSNYAKFRTLFDKEDAQLIKNLKEELNKFKTKKGIQFDLNLLEIHLFKKIN